MNTAAGLSRSNTPQELINIGIPVLVVMAIVFNVFAFIFALRWSQAPFLGVLFYPRLVATDNNNPTWQARQLGMQIGDRLLAIDDIPISSGRDLYLFLGQRERNDSVLLNIERATAQPESLSDTLAVSLSNFKWPDLFIFFWLPFLIGLIYLALGITVYRLRGTEQGANIFLVFCILVSVLAGGIFDQNTLHFLTPIWAIAFPLTGAALVHLALVFPKPTRLSRRKPWLPLIPYGVALILGSANIYSFYFFPEPRLYLTIRFWNFGLIGVSMALFLILQLNARLATISSLVRQQTSIIFWGSIIAFSPAAIWVIATGMDVQLPFVWPIFSGVFAPFVVFPVAIAYAMLRYRLLDLDIVFNRGVVYTLLSLLVVVVYLLVVSFLGVLFQDSELFDNPLILAIFVVVLVISLDPLKQSLQAVVNRLFLRESFDYRRLLRRYGRALISTPLNTTHILEMLTTYAGEAIVPELAVVFLRDATQGVFAVRYPTGGSNLEIVEVRFGLSDDLAQWLADTNNILQLTPDGTAPPKVNISREELARLKMLNITLCVPLLGSENLLGWLALGLKKSGQPYMSNDLLFLATLASQTTIALENAQLLEEANRRAVELEILQKISIDIQTEAEPDTLLASVVERAIKLLRAEGGLVFLLEPDNKTLKVVVSHNLDQDYTNYTLEVPAGIAGRVVMLGKSVIVDHYHNFSGRSRKFQMANFGAVLGVPLHWAGTVRGVLYLIHQPHGLRFSEDDVWLMELFATQSAIALEQSRLLQEARGIANQLTVLSEVSTAISATLDLDTTLLRILNGAVEILNAEAGSLLLVDSTGKELIFEVVLGPTGEGLLGVKTPVGKGIVGTVAQTGEPLIINDVTTDSRWDVGFDKDTEFQTKDLLCVPMISHERVVGVVEILNKQGGTFDQEDCTLLMAFGAQAAVAIENAQRFTRTDQALAGRVQELHTLQMFDQQLQTSLQLNTVLDTTLTYAMDALGVSIGLLAIFIKEADEPGLYLLAQRGLPMEMGRYKKDPWPLTRGVLGRVAQTGEAELSNDISQAKDYIPKTHRTRSLLVVPIMREGHVIGVIDLEGTEPDYFTEDDLSFVNILVSHSAFAIENAQLFGQVDQANQAKSEFMNTASHELKIPMTSIKGYAKLLQMGTAGSLTDQQTEFLEVISNNVNRMDRLVADLLDVSRIEAGRIRLELQNVQMSNVINDVIGSVQTQIDKKSLNLNLQVEDDLPEIRADYGRMVQIVTNLVSNAYKYTPEGGDITVRASPYNGNIKGIAVTVKDTGYGISEEDQVNLFTTFFRSSDQNIRDEMGTGLGLSITKKMIESHGGELTFESEYGQGTTFTFTIPLVSEMPTGVEVIER
jgi:signal transduction histidine kinase